MGLMGKYLAVTVEFEMLIGGFLLVGMGFSGFFL
jgi:hypothetical protein